jgi:hypothetical protein
LKVGIETIPYRCAMAGLASVSTLTNFIDSPCWAAISSTIGDIWRHGAHQAAQKSTSTGLSDRRTSSSKVASVTAVTDVLLIVLLCSLPPQTRTAPSGVWDASEAGSPASSSSAR